MIALSTVLPSLLLLAYFRGRDVYPEPARVVWTTFGLGVLSVIPVLAFALPLSALLGDLADPFARAAYEAFILAALPEETCKILVLVLYARRHSAFDEPMDGVVYGVAASLGFATMENVLYVAQGGLGVAILRALTSIPGHATFGAIMGYYLGQAAFDPRRARGAMIAAFAWPLCLHGLYDFPLLAAREAAGGPHEAAASAAMSAVPVLLVASIVAALRMSRVLRQEQLAQRTGANSPAARAAAGARRGGRAWMIAVVLGGLLASAGGLVILAIAVAIADGGFTDAEVPQAIAGAAIVGVAPLIVGLLVFRLGVRRLNCGP